MLKFTVSKQRGQHTKLRENKIHEKKNIDGGTKLKKKENGKREKIQITIYTRINVEHKKKKRI